MLRAPRRHHRTLLPIARRTVRFRRPVLHVQVGNCPGRRHLVAKPASCAPVKHSRAVSSEGARTVHSGVRMVRTVCAPLILCALTSPARSYATRCSLLPPRSGEACKARHATWGCVQSQVATAGALLELRPLANACLCEALGRQTRGSFDFCGPAEEQHSWTCDCTPRRPSTVPANASSRSWTSAAAAGRGPSDAVPAAPSGRLVLIGQVQQAVRRRTPAASCR